MNILVVDDEPLARARLKRLLANSPAANASVTEAASAEAAIELHNAQTFDVAILDIEMPGQSGLMLAKILSEQVNPPAIMFVTAYANYALDAFSVNAQDYLVKPVTQERLDEALLKLVRSHRMQGQNYVAGGFRYNEKGVEKQLQLNDIHYFQADAKYTRVVTKQQDVLLELSLKRIVTDFPEHFVRIHRNTVVNRYYVKRVYTDAGQHLVELKDGTALEVSRREWAQVKLLAEQGILGGQ